MKRALRIYCISLLCMRPKLEYASEVWDPHFQCDIKQLERVQRLAARFCKRDYSYKSSVTTMFKDLEWEPLALRRKQARLMTMYKSTNDIIHINLNIYFRLWKPVLVDLIILNISLHRQTMMYLNFHTSPALSESGILYMQILYHPLA